MCSELETLQQVVQQFLRAGPDDLGEAVQRGAVLLDGDGDLSRDVTRGSSCGSTCIGTGAWADELVEVVVALTGALAFD